MQIELNVFDSIFCRDGKPFTMGSEVDARTIFPPFPSTVYGMLRTIFFTEQPQDLVKVDTDKDPTRGLQIKGIYMQGQKNGGESDIYFPLPADCVKDNFAAKNKDNNAVCLCLAENSSTEIVSNCSFPFRLSPAGESLVTGIGEGIVTALDMREYLKGRVTSLTFSQYSDFITTESKAGISRDYGSHTVKEACLYNVDLKRLETRENRMNFVIEYEGLELPEKGFGRLGGEGRLVEFKSVDNNEIRIDKVKLENDFFKLYFATPTVFANGYLPAWIDESSLEGEYNGCKVRLVAAAIGKYCHIGGWDMKRGRAKTMYRGVPSGSVYVFQNLSTDKELANNAFHAQLVTDYEVYSKQGFGLAFVGKVRC